MTVGERYKNVLFCCFFIVEFILLLGVNGVFFDTLGVFGWGDPNLFSFSSEMLVMIGLMGWQVNLLILLNRRWSSAMGSVSHSRFGIFISNIRIYPKIQMWLVSRVIVVYSICNKIYMYSLYIHYTYTSTTKNALYNHYTYTL